MNNLNSVLLEGTLVDVPERIGDRVQFTLASNHYFKDAAGNFIKDVNFFDIEVPDVGCDTPSENKLGNHCVELGKKGRGVRIVGRLKQYRNLASDGNNGFVVVIAEHVEFRPMG